MIKLTVSLRSKVAGVPHERASNTRHCAAVATTQCANANAMRTTRSRRRSVSTIAPVFTSEATTCVASDCSTSMFFQFSRLLFYMRYTRKRKGKEKETEKRGERERERM